MPVTVRFWQKIHIQKDTLFIYVSFADVGPISISIGDHIDTSKTHRSMTPRSPA